MRSGSQNIATKNCILNKGKNKNIGRRKQLERNNVQLRWRSPHIRKSIWLWLVHSRVYRAVHLSTPDCLQQHKNKQQAWRPLDAAGQYQSAERQSAERLQKAEACRRRLCKRTRASTHRSSTKQSKDQAGLWLFWNWTSSWTSKKAFGAASPPASKPPPEPPPEPSPEPPSASYYPSGSASRPYFFQQ